MSYFKWSEYFKTVCIRCELVMTGDGQYIDGIGHFHDRLTDNILIDDKVCRQCIQRIYLDLHENMEQRDKLDISLKELMLD